MNFANETRFKNWFGHCIEAANGVCFALPVAGCFSQSGIPDRYVSHPVWHGFLEMKRNKGRLTTSQKLKLDSLMRTGTNALVVRHTDDEMMYFETWDGRVLKKVDMRMFANCGIRSEGHWGHCLLAILATVYEDDVTTDRALEAVVERLKKAVDETAI